MIETSHKFVLFWELVSSGSSVSIITDEDKKASCNKKKNQSGPTKNDMPKQSPDVAELTTPIGNVSPLVSNSTTTSQKQQLVGSVSNTFSSTTPKSIVTASTSHGTAAERSERGSASDTYAEGSNLSDWKTDYGVRNSSLCSITHLYILHTT